SSRQGGAACPGRHRAAVVRPYAWRADPGAASIDAMGQQGLRLGPLPPGPHAALRQQRRGFVERSGAPPGAAVRDHPDRLEGGGIGPWTPFGCWLAPVL